MEVSNANNTSERSNHYKDNFNEIVANALSQFLLTFGQVGVCHVAYRSNLTQVAEETGDRAIVGKVNVDEGQISP